MVDKIAKLSNIFFSYPDPISVSGFEFPAKFELTSERRLRRPVNLVMVVLPMNNSEGKIEGKYSRNRGVA